LKIESNIGKDNEYNGMDEKRKISINDGLVLKIPLKELKGQERNL